MLRMATSIGGSNPIAMGARICRMQFLAKCNLIVELSQLFRLSRPATSFTSRFTFGVGDPPSKRPGLDDRNAFLDARANTLTSLTSLAFSELVTVVRLGAYSWGFDSLV